jgi:hypothetical protein
MRMDWHWDKPRKAMRVRRKWKLVMVIHQLSCRVHQMSHLAVDPENGAEDDEADKVTAKCDDAEVKEELWNSYLWEAIQVPREC